MAVDNRHSPGLERFAPFIWPVPGLLIAAWFVSPEIAGWAIAPFVLTGPFALAVAAHEAAHAAVAARNGLVVSIFSVYPFTARRLDERWQVRWGAMRGLAGFVAIAPSEIGADEFRRAYRRMALAGPLANLLLMPLAVAAGWWGVTSFSRTADVSSLIAGGGFFLANLLGLINIIPFQVGGHRTDGALFRLLADPRDAATFVGMNQTGHLALGVDRPRHWAGSDVAFLRDIVLTPTLDPLHREHRLAASIMLIHAYLDHGQAEDALAVATYALGPYPTQGVQSEPGRAGLLMFAAYLTVTQRGDVLTARSMLDAIPLKSPLRITGLFKAAEATLALTRGDREGARKAARTGQRMATRAARLFGTAHVEVDMLTSVLDRLDGHPSLRPERSLAA